MAVKATVRNNGPIRLEWSDPAEFALLDPTGKMFGLAGRTAISLCRCGHSADKPFCDGSHHREGFQSACKARDLPAPAPKPAL